MKTEQGDRRIAYAGTFASSRTFPDTIWKLTVIERRRGFLLGHWAARRIAN